LCSESHEDINDDNNDVESNNYCKKGNNGGKQERDPLRERDVDTVYREEVDKRRSG